MAECICSSCKNLKGIINENGNIEEYECQYGFPSEQCENCNMDGCDEVCSQYVCGDEEAIVKTVRCSICGKELNQASEDDNDGEVFCLDCYLNKRN